MKVRHHIRNGWTPPVSADERAWAARVEAAAEATTNRAEARHERLAERLARAEARQRKADAALARAKRERATAARIRKLNAAAEDRRQELLALHREMTSSPAGSQHRGNPAHRAVSMGDVL